MNEKPDLERGIYRVSHTLVVGQARYIAESDMIVENGEPYVILDWGSKDQSQGPAIKVRLDWNKLHPPKDGFTVYDGDVFDPRVVQ